MRIPYEDGTTRGGGGGEKKGAIKARRRDTKSRLRAHEQPSLQEKCTEIINNHPPVVCRASFASRFHRWTDSLYCN